MSAPPEGRGPDAGSGLDEAFLTALRVEFPGLSVVHKVDDGLSRVVDLFLRCVTFGGQRGYLDEYTTVIGTTLYLPSTWQERSPRSRYVTLRHEAVHLRQGRRWGRLGMALLYLLPALPVGLAYGRARLEWEAYAETFRATAEVFGAAQARSPGLRAHVLRQFTSAAYGWMWPFPRQVNRWIDALLSTLPDT